MPHMPLLAHIQHIQDTTYKFLLFTFLNRANIANCLGEWVYVSVYVCLRICFFNFVFEPKVRRNNSSTSEDSSRTRD